MDRFILKAGVVIAAAAFLIIVGVGKVWAGNGGFFTTYNSEIEKGEIELMLMNDFTAPSHFRKEEDGFGNYLSHMVELEYAPFHQFATELMVEWFEDLDKGSNKFTGYRWENRYRLIRDDVPFNPMIYAEYEDLDPATRYKMEVSGWINPPYEESGGEPDRERILESRMVLSDEIGPVNVAFNWINETDLENGQTAFGYSLGSMWMMHGHEEEDHDHDRSHGHAEISQNSSSPSYTCPMHPEVLQPIPGKCPKCGMILGHAPVGPSAKSEEGCTCKRHMKNCHCSHCRGEGGPCTCHHGGSMGLGMELYGAFGDTRSFGFSPSRQEHYAGPIFMYHINSDWMVHTQLAIGLSKASDNLLRLNVGYEF